MKVYLDDERQAPEGWRQAYTAYEAIFLLRTKEVTHLSLDHDLGDEKKHDCGNGYDVLIWIEQRVFNNSFTPPEITIHSSNSSARIKMELAVQSIEKEHRKNLSFEKVKENFRASFKCQETIMEARREAAKYSFS